ncbi:MAG: LPP20 family lipoprotein [Treponema sp.]|jgi:hypothetical protein|nr:LPP20 family lipoprotein [Treponema sp.]
MMMKRNVFYLFPLFLIFSFCGSSPSSNNAQGARTGSMPDWVNSVDSVFGRSQYVAAVGYADNRAEAERNALAGLTAFFGQSVQVDRTAVSAYHQAVTNGVTDSWIDTVDMRSIIKTSASMDNLMGAEIKEVWFDSRDMYYAVAVMEKAKCALLYNELILTNLNIIKNLVTIIPSEKNSLDGVIRYRFAAAAADINVSYSNIVRLLDGVPPEGIISGDGYSLEARNIARAVPVGITVTNDRQGRIFGAFDKCFSDLGFESGGGNSRYVLIVNAALTPVDLPANPAIFSRIELSANLTDTNLGLVLLPFNFTAREGHVSLAEAENRCITAAEHSINEEYRELLSAYLSRLMPKS